MRPDAPGAGGQPSQSRAAKAPSMQTAWPPSLLVGAAFPGHSSPRDAEKRPPRPVPALHNG